MGEKGNTHGRCWASLVGLLVCLLLGACFDPDHPDPTRYEGVLVRHPATASGDLLADAATSRAPIEQRTMVEAVIDDGQLR